MARGTSDAFGMSPLQSLILGRMREKGMSPKQVEERGVTHATLHRYMNPVELRMPPRQAVLQSLANALDLPLSRVQQAAVESVGYLYEHHPTAATTVTLGSLKEMSRVDQERAVAEVLAWAGQEGLLPDDDR